jgi:hypothetical protein
VYLLCNRGRFLCRHRDWRLSTAHAVRFLYQKSAERFAAELRPKWGKIIVIEFIVRDAPTGKLASKP